MTAQLSLPLSRTDDPETSRDAARRAQSGRVGLRKLILAELAHADLTDRELSRIICPDQPLRWQSVISARSSLKHDELVFDTGVRREGRCVWGLEEEGVRTIDLGGDEL